MSAPNNDHYVKLTEAEVGRFLSDYYRAIRDMELALSRLPAVFRRCESCGHLLPPERKHCAGHATYHGTCPYCVVANIELRDPPRRP